MPQPIVHWEMAVGDAKKLQSFYAEMFDWTVDANNSMEYGMVNTGGNGSINGGIFPAGDHPKRVTLYVAVPDLQAALDKAERLGGKTLLPPTEVPEGNVTLALFADPEGTVFGLVKG
jgi:predicted enzyme related to lactoylglutathione lyase